MRGSWLNDPCRELRCGEPDDWQVDQEAREEKAIAREAGTCCTDPTPTIATDDGGPGLCEVDGPYYYCQSCDTELTPEKYAALVAKLPALRLRIAQIRGSQKVGALGP